MRKRHALIALSAIYCLLTAVCSAQLPELINYQGRLVDESGLVTGDKTIVFRLFTNDVGGVETYAETQTVSVLDGLYATMLGASNPAPGALSGALNQQPCYLEVEVNGTTMLPRERLASAAYALNIDDVDVSFRNSSGTLTANEHVVLASNNITLTLPTADHSTMGKTYVVRHVGSPANIVQVQALAPNYLNSIQGGTLAIGQFQTLEIVGVDTTSWSAGQ